MIFLAVLLIFGFMPGFFALGAAATTNLVVLTIAVSMVNLVISPSLFLERPAVKPYAHARMERTRGFSRLQSSRESLSEKLRQTWNPFDQIRIAKTEIADTLEMYTGLSCSEFAEEALLDALSTDIRTLEQRVEQDYLRERLRFNSLPGLFMRPELVHRISRLNGLAKSTSQRNVVFVPLSLAREYRVDRVESIGPIVVYNDQRGVPLKASVIQVASQTAVLICDEDLSGVNVLVESPRILSEGPLSPRSLVPSSCDDKCLSQIDFYDYKTTLRKVIHALRD